MAGVIETEDKPSANGSGIAEPMSGLVRADPQAQRKLRTAKAKGLSCRLRKALDRPKSRTRNGPILAFDGL